MQAWCRILLPFGLLLSAFAWPSPLKAQSSSVIYDARLASLVADGKTDDAAALNRAITSAATGQYGIVQLPCGQILVQKTINMTNHSNITLQGCGSNQDYGGSFPSNSTQILCDTGTVCLDTTGSSRVTIKDLSLRAANNYKSPSKIGILLGRDNSGGGGSKNHFCFAQWNLLEHVYIYMDSYPAASPRGRIAVYNVGAEHFTIKGGKYIADQALELSEKNILGASSSYQALQDGCPASMTIVNVGEGASFQPWKYFAVEFNDVLDADFAQVHYICGKPGMIAVNFNSGRIKKISMKGQVEECAQFANSNTDLDHDRFDVLVVAPTKTIFVLNQGIKVSSSQFRIAQQNGLPQLLFNRGSDVTISGSQIDVGTLKGVSSPGIVATGSIVFAPDHHDSDVRFGPGSHYLLLSDDGISAIGGIRSH